MDTLKSAKRKKRDPRWFVPYLGNEPGLKNEKIFPIAAMNKALSDT